MTQSDESPADAARVDVGAPARLRRQGSAQLVRTLVDTFLGRMPARLEELRRSLAAGELESVRIGVHGLKSSALLMGALHMGALCQRAEDLAARAEPGGLAQLLGEIDDEFARVRPWVAGFCDPPRAADQRGASGNSGGS